MKRNRIFNYFFFLALLIGVCCFSYYYFHSLTVEISKYSKRDTEYLQRYNDEIVATLQNEGSTANWQKIIDSFEDVVIYIEDENSNVIAHSTGRDWSMVDTKVQKAFIFAGNPYMMKTSVYLAKETLRDSGFFYRTLIIIFMGIFLFFVVIIATIYIIMLRPLHTFYLNIENYEKGKKVTRSRKHSEIARLQNRFVDMTETIDKQQDNQRRIIASISHDIKTPLTSIMGYAELLKKENISEERKQRYLNTVYEKAVSIKELIDDFDEYLDYNMETALKTEKMTADTMMDKLTLSYEDELQVYGIKFVYNSHVNNDLVEVDMQKMRRVLGNIIGNSLKHFNMGIKIIEVEYESDDNFVKIIISDNGEGVPEEKLDVIFEPLYTSDEGRKVAGLGLAICREIVEAHGGEIYAEKSKYGGLAIVIKLKKIKL